jgi:hypothetical protein
MNESSRLTKDLCIPLLNRILYWCSLNCMYTPLRCFLLHGNKSHLHDIHHCCSHRRLNESTSSLTNLRAVLTNTTRLRIGSLGNITRFTRALNSIGQCIVRTIGIGITSTIVNEARICKQCRLVAEKGSLLPVQTTVDSKPVLVNPVLQVHSIAFVIGS